jgi:hypothetical protein
MSYLNLALKVLPRQESMCEMKQSDVYRAALGVVQGADE